MDTFVQHKILTIVYPYIYNCKEKYEYSTLFTHIDEENLTTISNLLNIGIDVDLYTFTKTIVDELYLLYNEYFKLENVKGITYNEESSKKYAAMYSDLSFLLRPVKENMIQYTDLQSGVIKMSDLKILNDYLDVLQYNNYLTES